MQIALAHEHITGGGFDLPAIKPIFDTYVAGFGLNSEANRWWSASSKPCRGC